MRQEFNTLWLASIRFEATKMTPQPGRTRTLDKWMPFKRLLLKGGQLAGQQMAEVQALKQRLVENASQLSGQEVSQIHRRIAALNRVCVMTWAVLLRQPVLRRSGES